MTVAIDIPPFPDNVPTAHIPTVDFNLLAQNDEASSKAVFNAATGYGFFFLKNHQVNSDFMFDLAEATFNLPVDELMKYDMGTTGQKQCFLLLTHVMLMFMHRVVFRLQARRRFLCRSQRNQRPFTILQCLKSVM